VRATCFVLLFYVTFTIAPCAADRPTLVALYPSSGLYCCHAQCPANSQHCKQLVTSFESTRHRKASRLACVLPLAVSCTLLIVGHTGYIILREDPATVEMYSVLILLAATATGISAVDQTFFFYPFGNLIDKEVPSGDATTSRVNVKIETGFPFMYDNHSTVFVSSHDFSFRVLLMNK